MNYTEAIAYIHETPKFSRVLGNDLLRKLLKNLGNPQDKLKFIHIAGTNGKGSTAVMLSEILKESGMKVGLFTSPFLEKFNERIQINNKPISNQALARIATDVKNVIEETDSKVSEFALDTAIAFLYFAKQKCDIVVLETGLGGRLDATNVIEKSVLSIIVSIGFDHMQYLGDTIEKITAEKCGIIKENGNVVVYPLLDKKAVKVIKKACREKSAKYYVADLPTKIEDRKFLYNDKEYRISMSGEFQYNNAATVLKSIEFLNENGYNISDEAIKKGLISAFNPGRLEMLKNGLYLDGAHNPPAASELVRSLKNMNKPVAICLAMMSDKDISGCVKEFSKLSPKVYITRLDMPRCAEPKMISEMFKECGVKARIISNPINAVNKMMSENADSICVVCGSLYLIGEVRSKVLKNLKTYYIYMLRCENNSIYTGITSDVKRRFFEHSNKTKAGAKYTHAQAVKKLEAVWKCESKSEALRLETFIKRLTKSQKEDLIKNPNILEVNYKEELNGKYEIVNYEN